MKEKLYVVGFESLWLQFLCHQHLCCVAYRDCFIIQFCGVVAVVVCRCHTLYSGQYLKNGLWI